jgi:hypothetical protein
MFRAICEFNELRVAKTARSATPARSICRPAFSGMMCINFLRPKMSTANEPTYFALFVKIFLSSAFVGRLMITPACGSISIGVLDRDVR